jgi:hypothetical protein
MVRWDIRNEEFSKPIKLAITKLSSMKSGISIHKTMTS